MANGQKYFLNGESWRIITPLLLVILTGTSSVGIMMLTDVKNDMEVIRTEVVDNRKTIAAHLLNPDYHYTLVARVNAIDKEIEKGGKP